MRKLTGVAVSITAAGLVFLSGCASMTEMCRGFAGTSTRIIDEKRPEALKKEFQGDIQTVSARVRESLKKTGCYVYRQEPDKGLTAVYLSEKDTTPAGVYLTQLDSGATLVEVSSPSTYAREFLIEKLSGDLKDLIKVEKKETTEEPVQEKTDEKK